MIRRHTIKTKNGPPRCVPHRQKAPRRQRAVLRRAAKPAGGTGHAGPNQASKAKEVILLGGAGLVAILLLIFTIHAVFTNSETRLRDLLDLTQYLAAAVLLGALGSKIGRLVGYGKDSHKNGR